MQWNCGDYSFDTKMPIIMGILNVTPDSFSDGGQYYSLDAALKHAQKLLDDGAHIIDVGGESTRPGAQPVDTEEEIRRIVPLIEELVDQDVCVSVDTYHPDVALEALRAGACIINDITGFRDPRMVDIAKNCDAGLVVMHMQGEPGTMQDNPTYTDVVDEVRDFLATQAHALEAAGVSPDRICIDPGPGFGKTPQQSLDLMRNLTELVHLGYLVMAAPSRKSYLAYAYKTLTDSKPEERDIASAAECLLACEQGANVLRVHDVALTAAGLRDLRPAVLIGLGCNDVPADLLERCGNDKTRAKKTLLNRAIGALSMLPDSELIDVSGYYESEPAYYENQDTFVNAVVLLRCGEAPLELLEKLHEIEESLGRTREIENGPRTCDLDILDYQMYVYSNEELTLPHPGVCERDFVVKPILEIRPNHVLANGKRVDSIPESERVGKAKRL